MLTTPNEITARYEEQRRTRMLRKVLALDAFNSFLAFIALAIVLHAMSPRDPLRTPILISEVVLLIIVGTLWLAFRSMRQQKNPFAYWIAVVMATVGAAGGPMVWAVYHGIDDMALLETVPFCLGILHLAMFGSRAALIRYTVVLNMLTVVTYSAIPVLFHQPHPLICRYWE